MFFNPSGHMLDGRQMLLGVYVCLLGYGPQEGLPVFARRSYGSGFLCGLRCSVGPFSSVL
jgi:hypothetical protein